MLLKIFVAAEAVCLLLLLARYRGPMGLKVYVNIISISQIILSVTMVYSIYNLTYALISGALGLLLFNKDEADIVFKYLRFTPLALSVGVVVAYIFY